MQNGTKLWISQIYFLMKNPVDRVHGAWIMWRGSGPPSTEAARTKGRGGALSAHGRKGSLVLIDGGGGGQARQGSAGGLLTRA
jgi:hypothetical protein